MFKLCFCFNWWYLECKLLIWIFGVLLIKIFVCDNLFIVIVKWF